MTRVGSQPQRMLVSLCLGRGGPKQMVGGNNIICNSGDRFSKSEILLYE